MALPKNKTLEEQKVLRDTLHARIGKILSENGLQKTVCANHARNKHRSAQEEGVRGNRGALDAKATGSLGNAPAPAAVRVDDLAGRH